MIYRFDHSEGSLKQRLCAVYGVQEKDLDVSDFDPDYQLDIIKDFSDFLLSAKDKRFFIVGDYDCDGICATVIVSRLLRSLGISSNYYIPSRLKEGYGLNTDIVETAHEYGFDCLLCVDNGIIAQEALKLARELGLTTVIIDHHEYEELPDVDLVIHPALFPAKYKDMCAAGLCALLGNALVKDDLNTVYGGLATMADMVSVFGYNRWLIKTMMDILKSQDILPIRYLLGRSELSYDALTFNVIPKINAVSRLDEYLNVNYVVRYLLDNSQECLTYLDKIEEINRLRKELSRSYAASAGRLALSDQDVIVVASAAFKEGLCGVVANRLLSEYQKPVLIFAETAGLYKGSGRAPQGVDLHGYLRQAGDIYETFGGHQQAVGLSLNHDGYQKLQTYISTHPLKSEEVFRDVLIYDQDEINDELLRQIEDLQPFGTGFAKPLLCMEKPRISRQFTIGSAHYPKYVLNDSLEAVCFHNGLKRDQEQDFIGYLQRDDYHRDRLLFIIEDLREY